MQLRHLLFTFFFMAALYVQGQGNGVLNIQFRPLFNGVPLTQGKGYFTPENDTIKVEVFKMYVSGIRLYKNGKEVFKPASSYYLLDITNPESLIRTVTLPDNLEFDAVRFYFGIDDSTNNKGVGEGDLDPANDMYWAWQTGYINMKLEGTFGKSQKPYQFHLGGFLPPYASFKEVTLTGINGTNLTIGVDLGNFFQTLILNRLSAVMSPGSTGVGLSGTAAQMFRVL